MTQLKYSADHRTAWAIAYNVYRERAHLGVVYLGHDGRWHSIRPDGSRGGPWHRRKDAGYFLEQPHGVEAARV